MNIFVVVIEFESALSKIVIKNHFKTFKISLKSQNQLDRS